MNRNDVIDILTVVAAATRRTVGEADVEIWQEIIGGDDKEIALKAVRDHLAERPGVWLEPGHVHQRVRSYVRDRLERESDSAREARQEALAAKAAEDVALLAERRGLPRTDEPARFMRPELNPLRVRCPWCHVGVGERCEVPGTDVLLSPKLHLATRGVHPARVEAIEAAGGGLDG